MGHVRDLWHKKGPDGKLERTSYYGKGKRWQARYDTPSGPKTKLFAKKVDAEKEVTKQDAAVLAGDWLDPEAGKVKVREYAFDVWLPAQDIGSRTETEYRGVLNRYLVPEWGRREIRTIRPSQAGAWQALLTKKYELSGTTPNKVARHVRSIFKLAVIERVIRVSPFDGIKAPTADETEVHPPDVAEMRRLVDAAYSDLWRDLWELDALTGLRSGELRGMRLQCFDALRKAYSVEQQLVYESGKGLSFDDLKTSAGRRVIPLNKRAVEILARRIEKHPPPTKGPWAGLIFTTADGKPIGESSIDYALKATCKAASLAPRHLHEIRHHYASVLIAGGENPRVVQKRLGHKDIKTTLRVYAHLWAEAEEQTRSVLDAAWAAPSKTGGAEERALASVTKIT